MPINNLTLPTTSVWDPSVLQDIEVNSPEFKELLVRLYQNINLVAVAVNLKDTGYYDTFEFVNNQRFFPNPALNSLTGTQPTFRDVIRKVINFGTLPNAGTTSVAHGITLTANTTFTRIYGCSSDTTNNVYIPLPFDSAGTAQGVELLVSGLNVTIITESNRSTFTVTYVVLEYLQT
jgi:hypothetical protein